MFFKRQNKEQKVKEEGLNSLIDLFRNKKEVNDWASTASKEISEYIINSKLESFYLGIECSDEFVACSDYHPQDSYYKPKCSVFIEFLEQGFPRLMERKQQEALEIALAEKICETLKAYNINATLLNDTTFGQKICCTYTVNYEKSWF